MAKDFDSWIKTARPVTKSVDVCLDRQLVADLEEAEAERERLSSNGMLEGAPEELQERIAQLAAEVQDRTLTFTFRNMGWRKWERLRDEHPPTEEDREAGLDHNPATFPVAATAACSVEPELTLEQAESLFETAPPSVVSRIWSTVFLANLEAGDEKKALATAATASTETK